MRSYELDTFCIDHSGQLTENWEGAKQGLAFSFLGFLILSWGIVPICLMKPLLSREPVEITI